MCEALRPGAKCAAAQILLPGATFSPVDRSRLSRARFKVCSLWGMTCIAVEHVDRTERGAEKSSKTRRPSLEGVRGCEVSHGGSPAILRGRREGAAQVAARRCARYYKRETWSRSMRGWFDTATWPICGRRGLHRSRPHQGHHTRRRERTWYSISRTAVQDRGAFDADVGYPDPRWRSAAIRSRRKPRLACAGRMAETIAKHTGRTVDCRDLRDPAARWQKFQQRETGKASQKCTQARSTAWCARSIPACASSPIPSAPSASPA